MGWRQCYTLSLQKLTSGWPMRRTRTRDLILNEITFGDERWFKTLSPVYVKTIRKENEDLREVDLYPKDPKFYENLHKTLIQRFYEFYDKAPQDHFDIIEIKDMKPKRIKIADGYRRCSLFHMRLQTNPLYLLVHRL